MNNDQEIIEYIKHHLESTRGDDLERAEFAFNNCTAEEMRRDYRMSGKSRQAILDEYKEGRAKYERAMQWLKSR